jgi:hypothetical protein
VSRPRFVWVTTVEGTDSFLSIFQVISGDFSRLIIADPLDRILEPGAAPSASAVVPGVNDFFNFPFLKSVDFNWRGWFWALARQGILHSRFQETDVEYRMDTHDGRQL